MRTIAVATSLAFLALGCTPDVNKDEVTKQLFGKDRGVIAGYDFGDSWDTIKKDHDPLYKLRDEKGFEQLRRDLSDPGSEGFFVTFKLDGDNKVKGLGASVYGSKQNAVTVRMILDDAMAHYDKTIGKGRCGRIPGGEGNSTSCDWATPGKPRVHLMYLEYKDPIRGSLDIDIEPPGE